MTKNWKIGFLPIVFSVFLVSSSYEEYPRVTTPLGKIKGYYKLSSKNQTYEAYEGIPYAIPPTGYLRFEPPLPIVPWINELDATKRPSKCLQADPLKKSVYGEEDCLVVNVYVPIFKNATPFPVVVWIHGGAFQQGFSLDFRPTHVMNKNEVIFVTFNYRLGPFGFLSTDDEVVPGNMGLKDQSLALQWISSYIKYFGGDRKRVTLTGCSAGGSSVHFHYITPMSVGLFQNAVSSSGTVLSPWSYNDDPMEDTLKLAKLVNCSTHDTVEIVRCLKKTSGMEIGAAVLKILEMEYLDVGVLRGIFLPVAEKVKYNYFINRPPKDILKSGEVYDVPWIAGASSGEGMFVTFTFQNNQTRLSFIDENWEKVGPYMMMFRSKIPRNKHAMVAELSRRHYLGNKSLEVNDDVLQGLIDLVSDIDVRLDVHDSVKLHAAATRSSVHLYYYDYKTSKSNIYGVPHCDDCLFILTNDNFNFTADLENTRMLENSLNFIYSLASGDHLDWIKTWPRINPKSEFLHYIQINGPNNLTYVSDDNFAQRKFWAIIDALVQQQFVCPVSVRLSFDPRLGTWQKTYQRYVFNYTDVIRILYSGYK